MPEDRFVCPTCGRGFDSTIYRDESGKATRALCHGCKTMYYLAAETPCSPPKESDA